MAENFYTILTDIGLAKVANSQVMGDKVDLVEMAIGDGNGNYYNPTSDMNELRREVWRGAIGAVEIDDNNANWIVVETVIPSTVGGFTVREVGLFDEAGDLIAIGKYPETYKPVLSEGSAKDLYIRMIIEVSNASAVTLKVDPTVIIASRKYVDEKATEAKRYTDAEIEKIPQTDLSGLTTDINRLRTKNTTQDRELAYLKLQQDAKDRIDGGTTFADDMAGNSFGMKFNDAESENIVIRDGAMLMLESTQETVTVEDATVVNQPYDTGGNGGRKLVRLDSGTLISVVKLVNGAVRIQKSIDNGISWSIVKSISISVSDVCIVSYGLTYHVLISHSNTSIISYSYDEFGIELPNKITESGQTAIGNVSLAINPSGTELHAAWSSKNGTYPNSFNIRYAKGTINHDGSVTWGAVEQVTKFGISGQDATQPSIEIANGKPIVVFVFNDTIHCTVIDGAKWIEKAVYNSSYAQSSPSAIFVPSEINGLPNGRIWVAWHGTDATQTTKSQIRISYSDDGGATWSTMQKVTSGDVVGARYPSLTGYKNGKIVVLYETQDQTLTYVKRVEYEGAWGNQITSAQDGSLPSALFDLSMNNSTPLFICKAPSKVGFYGAWTAGTESPTLTGTAVYDLPSTDYVGAFVQKAGVVDVDAYINGAPMDADLENNEYMFEKTLPSEAPVKLRLELSRADTTDGRDDKVTRILGGIA